jgi:hypothetical protein
MRERKGRSAKRWARDVYSRALSGVSVLQRSSDEVRVDVKGGTGCLSAWADPAGPNDHRTATPSRPSLPHRYQPALSS